MKDRRGKARHGFPIVAAIAIAGCGCGARTLASEPCQLNQTRCGETCAALNEDPTNCGACGNVCPQGTVCFDGTCATSCGGGTTQCGQSCVDPNVDHANCGGCNAACGPGEACVSGKCSTTCGDDQSLCVLGGGDAYCANTASDNQNCGACGKACPSDEACSGSTCGHVCPSGQTLCGAECVSLDSDAAHCGGCGHACSSAHGGAACVGGQCELTFCAAGYADCDGNPTNGCETDLSSDSASCGRCGHDCCEGACSNGQCQPAFLTYATYGPFALDTNDVYFADQLGNSPVLFECPKTGCGNGKTQVAVGHGAEVVDANNFYSIAGNNAVMECSKTACDSTAHALAVGSTSTWVPITLAVDSTTVYWTAKIASGSTTVGGVMSCPISGCTAPTELGRATSAYNHQAWGIALYGASVYWSDDAVVYECPKSGCGPTPLNLGLPGDGKVLVDGTHAYSLVSDESVWGCTISDCSKTATEFSVNNANQIYDLAADGTNVYWTQGQMVVACAAGGCSQMPSALAVFNDRPRWLATDGKCVYAQTGDSSYIYEVATP